MAVRRMRLQGPCPACSGAGLDYVAADMDLPYFGGVTQLFFSCETCGYRHSDIIIGSARDPMRFTLKVRRPQDLWARVVRSTSGTVRIPELGALIEPGPASDAYVTNVEGILDRIQRVIEQLGADAEDAAAKAECTKRLSQVSDAREARMPFTLFLEDPYGNSAILHEGVRQEVLSPKEAAMLTRGEFTLELTEEATRQVTGVEPSGNGHGAV